MRGNVASSAAVAAALVGLAVACGGCDGGRPAPSSSSDVKGGAPSSDSPSTPPSAGASSKDSVPPPAPSPDASTAPADDSGQPQSDPTSEEAPASSPPTSPPPAKARLVVYLTDDPFPRELAKDVVVTISEVHGFVSDSPVLKKGWHVLSTEPRTYDVLSLQNGVRAVLLDSDVPVGTWRDFRLVITAAHVTLTDDRVFDLKIPSDELKVKIEPPIVVATGLTPELLLDLDLDDSLVAHGNTKKADGIKGFTFKPVLRATNLTRDGRITGVVSSDHGTPEPEDDRPLAGATVTARLAGVVVQTATTDASGAYVLADVPAGTGYEVTADEPFHEAKTISDVTVLAGNSTEVGVTLALVFGELTGFVSGGPDVTSLLALEGVRVTALTPETPTAFTDAFGRYTLKGVRAGRRVVVADGFDAGCGRAYMTVDVVRGQSTPATRVLLLTSLAPGVPVSLDAQGRLTAPVVVSNPSIPGAALTISAGSHLILPGDVSTVASLSVTRIAIGGVANRLPDTRWAPYFYTFEPAGATVPEGYRITLPNDLQLPPGETTDFYQFDPRTGDYFVEGTLTVSPDGARLEGTFNSDLGMGAAVVVGHTVQVNGTLDYSQDPSGQQLNQLLIQSQGSLFTYQTNTSTPTTILYSGNVVVGSNQPPSSQTITTTNTNTGTSTSTTTTTSSSGQTTTTETTTCFLSVSPAKVISATGLLVVTVSGAMTEMHALSLVNNDDQKLAMATAFDPNPTDSTYYFFSPAAVGIPAGPFKLINYVTGPFNTVTYPETMVLDDTPPEAAITDIPDCTRDLSAVVGIEVRDDVGVASWEVQRAAGAAGPWTTVVSGSGGGAKVVTARPNVPLLAGTNYLRVVAMDLASNQGTSDPASTVADLVPPELTRIEFVGGFLHRAAMTIEFTATDAHTQVEKVELLRDGVVVQASVRAGKTVSGSFVEPVPFMNGTFSYSLRATDSCGNVVTSNGQSVVFDSLAPTVTASVQQTGPNTFSVTFTTTENGLAGLAGFRVQRFLAGDDQDESGVEVADGALAGLGPETRTVNDAIPSDGRFEYFVEVFDQAGNVGEYTVAGVVVDQLPATVTGGGGLDGGTFGPGKLDGTLVIDDQVGVDEAAIQVAVDGGELPISITTETVGGVVRTTVTFTVLKTVEGTHQVSYSVTDLGGHETTGTFEFTTDLTAPEVKSVSPPADQPVPSSTVTFEAEYEDVLSEIDPVLVVASDPVDLTPVATITPTSIRATVELEDGPHTFTLTLTDEGGNTTVHEHRVFVDTRAPAIAVTRAPAPSPAWNADARAPLSATFDDQGGSGVKVTRLFLDGQDVTSQATLTPTSLSFAASGLASGPHEYRLEITDAAGHQASTTIAFQVDALPPDTPRPPLAGVRPLEQTLTLRWLPVVDVPSGVAEYRVLRTEDGGKTWSIEVTTSALEAEVRAPTNETTAFRLVAVDLAGNQSAPADAESCKAGGIDELTTPVTTTLRVRVVRSSGAPVADALVREISGTDTPLTHLADGVYESAPITVPAGQPLTLGIETNGVQFVSGPLLPLLPSTVTTDFKTVVVSNNHLTAQLFVASGRTPPPPATAEVGASVGEPGAAGPPLLSSSRYELGVGLWHQSDETDDVLVHVLPLLPAICREYVPITFEVVGEDSPYDVAVTFSTDGGRSYRSATIVPGTPLTGLRGTPLGRRHMALWHTGPDLGTLALADVLVRVAPAQFPLRGQEVATTLVRSFRVEQVEPARESRAVDPGAPFRLTFSAPVTSDRLNLEQSILVLDALTGVGEALDFTVAGDVVTATPRQALAPDREYLLRVAPGLRHATLPFVFDQEPFDLLVTPFVAAYRTGGVDARAPRLVSSTPAHGSADVATNATIELTFDEDLDGSTVDEQTFVLTSSGAGLVPATVRLLNDDRTVRLRASLDAGRCYTVSVSQELRDVAGNNLVDFTHVTFKTASPSLSLSTPRITSPRDRDLLTDPEPAVLGTGPAGFEVHLFVNGFPTGLRSVVRADGTWSIVPFPLPDGDLTLFAVAASPGGSPASAPSGTVSVRLETDRIEGSTPSAPGETDVHEVLAGALEEPYHQYELLFTGERGAPFVIDATTLRPSQGLFAAAELRVAAANGGGTYQVNAGQQTLGAGTNSFDQRGEARVVYRANDVTKDGVTLRLVNPLDGSATAPQEVRQRAPYAFVEVGDSLPFDGPTNVNVALRGRLLRSPESKVVPASGYPACVRAVDPDGNPTDAVTINGQPGSTGAAVTADANGNVSITFEHNEASEPFCLVVESKASFDCPPFDRLESTELGHSDCFDPTNSAPNDGAFLVFLVDPANNLNTGKINTCGESRPCPPDPPTDAQQAPELTNPLNVDVGGKLEARTDLVVPAAPGRGAPLQWSRLYKGYGLYSGPLGHRWTHPYDQRLLLQSNGDVLWVTGTARTERFRSLGGGRFQTPDGFDVVLTVDADGVGTVRDPFGGKRVFRPFGALTAPGALAELREPHGNRLIMEYGVTGVGAGRLAAIVDPLGRRLDLGLDRLGRIVTVTDHMGRQVKYRYGRNGDLVSATSPEVMTTTEGEVLSPENQFPQGRTEVYAYSSGYADERQNHQLLMVVAPVEAALVPPGALEDQDVLRPLARLENVFDLDPRSPSYGKVVKQRWGGQSQLPTWTGITGPQEAGGWTSFSYEELALPPNASLNHPARKTTIVDRSGNLIEQFHNRNGQCVRVRQHTNRNVRPGDPPVYEATWIYDHHGLLVCHTLPLGNVARWIAGDEDLNGDGLLTPGEDRNGDGDFDDPEDVQAEDDPRFAFRAGNGQLDQRPAWLRLRMLKVIEEPDARGDTRGGRRPRIRTFEWDPVFSRLIRSTDPRGYDPDYTPQNGGVASAERYTTRGHLDYEQGDAATTLAALAAELSVGEAELQALLDETQVTLGRGDLNGSPADDVHRFGDPVCVEAPRVTVVPSQTTMQAVYGPTQAIVTLFETSPLGQPLRTVDAEGNVTLFAYHPEADPDGDGVPEPGATSTRLAGGWLAEVLVDAAAMPGRDAGTNPAPVRARTRFFYDRAGNPTRTIDPRGVEHRASYNALNEVVRARTATAVVGPVTEPGLTAFDYEALFFYDANGRPVETRVENAGERDGTGVTVASNPYWTRKVAYDKLDGPVMTLAEVEPIQDDGSITVSSPGVVVSQRVYEPNRDVRLVVKPEGNTVAFVHDERGRLAHVVDGVGTPEQATISFHVDLNGNRVRIVDAVKHNPSKNTGFTGDVTRLTYDGFDEQICSKDGEGNCGDAVFDPLGQRVRYVRHGSPEEGEPRLFEAEWLYDEAGRPFRSDVRVFTDLTRPFDEDNPAFQAIPTVNDVPPAGEQEAIDLVEFDALGRVLRAVDPRGDESLAAWDGAGRLVAAFGPMFANLTGANAVRNEVRFSYNQVGLPVAITSVDRSPVGATQTFTSAAAYDSLGRLLQATDPVGQTGRLVYDSRGNVIAASDAKSSVLVPNLAGLSPGLVNGHGNVALAFFDGLSRPIRSEVLLKKNGVGDGSLDSTNLDTSNPANQDGKITIEQRFDRNSRLVARSDDSGNTTAYAYDSRDRLVYTVGADLSVQRTIYDADSMVRQTLDRNGTVVDRTYDAIGRLLKVQATLRATNLEGTGQAVEGTAVQAFEYDGLSRVRLAVDQNEPFDPSDDVVTSFSYDSLSRQLTERHRFRAQTSLVNTFTTNNRITVGAAQIDRTISREFDLDSNRTATTYSSGRRLDYLIDGADRLHAITDSLGTITATEVLGSRPIASTTGRGTVSTTYSYDLKRRLTGLDHLGQGGQRAAGFSYTWDRADRRSSETHLAAPGVQARTETYTYDSAYRITQVAFGDARPNTSWVIDGVGNWVSRTEGGQAQTTNQRQNGKYAPDLMNEVQRLATFDALGSLVKDEQQTQDPNGNRIRSGEFRLSFDVFDRLVRVERTSDGQTVGRYRYDALGRRVDRWFVAKGEAVGQQVFHVSDGAQEVEEVDGSGGVVADYVWGGLYLDQVVQVRRGGQEYFAHTNSMFSVAALTDASGAVVERYEYASIYGVCEVRDAAGAARPASEEIGNPWRFQGRRYDPETGWYYFRLRYLDPAQGRFVSRDPLGIWGDASNLGNGYAFAGNDPVNRVDPFGLMNAPGAGSNDGWNSRADYHSRLENVDAGLRLLNPAPGKTAWSEFWGGIGEGVAGLGQAAVRVTSVPLNATRALVSAEVAVITGKKGLFQVGGELSGQIWGFATEGPKGLYQFGKDIVAGLSGEARPGGRAVFGLAFILALGRSGGRSKGIVDPVPDNVLIQDAYQVWQTPGRVAAGAYQAMAWAFFSRATVRWLITQTNIAEFIHQYGGSVARRWGFLNYLESTGRFRILDAAQHAALEATPAFQSTFARLMGYPQAASFAADIRLAAQAHAAGIKFITRDFQFVRWLETHDPCFRTQTVQTYEEFGISTAGGD